jgi:3-oxoadipate enol-lactonase
MGGSTALQLAAAHPERVNRLFLADTTAWYGPDAAPIWGERADRVLAQPRTDQVTFQVDRWFTTTFSRRRLDVVRSVVRAFLATDSVVHASACRALGAMDLRSILGRVTAPTVVVTGVEDYATPPEMGRAIADLVPRATAEVLDGLRHLSLIERPELAQAVGEHFLRVEVR